ncbi:MAG: hypothetical protein KDD70_04360 [Bdellovibrionales bacterium]|nr:hypothetical protein [Bdellovibrionales bacterium]
MSTSINTETIQEVTTVPATSALSTESLSSSASSTGSSEFDGHLRALLSSTGSSVVNEEELFAAVIQERLQATKGDSAAEAFSQQFEQHKSELTRGDGYINVEKAANMALEDMVTAGHLTESEHDEVYDHSFMAAQLDSNLTALYDGRGGEGDATIATADLETALLSARAALEALANGELPAAALAAETTDTTDATSDEVSTEGGDLVTPDGVSVDGADEFVFKPESESDGKLVILLPTEYSRRVADLLLKDENGNIIERGRGTGVANGNREHFRFERAGADYPENLVVEVRLTSGELVQYEIADPSQRYD